MASLRPPRFFPWLLLLFTILYGISPQPVLAQADSEPLEPCGCGGQTFFLCRLTDGHHVAVCGQNGEAEGNLQLDVRMCRGQETVWLWPEDLAEVLAEKATTSSFSFERQTHVRSVSYHLWFERGDEVIDLVDHWTEGSHDSHFAGLIVQGPGEKERQTFPCDDAQLVLRLADLADHVPHRPVPVP